MRSQMLSVAKRVLNQLVHDRRFMALSVIVPVFVILILYLFFDSVENPFFRPKEFLPPVGAYIVHFLAYVLSIIVLVRERTQHTMTRMFVSGYRQLSIIGGYVMAYSFIATLQSLIVLVLLNWSFSLEYSLGMFVSMYLVIWVLAVISIALGIFISNFARNEGQVLPTVPMVLIPSIAFSGMIVAVNDLPEWTRVFSYVTPMYYANNAINALREGDPVAQSAALLVAYLAIVMLLAILTLREQG